MVPSHWQDEINVKCAVSFKSYNFTCCWSRVTIVNSTAYSTKFQSLLTLTWLLNPNFDPLHCDTKLLNIQQNFLLMFLFLFFFKFNFV